MTTDVRKGCTSSSNAQADLDCPGRHRAQIGIPETVSDDANAGKAIHDALASGDVSKLTLEQSEMYDSCKAIENKLVLAYFGDKAPTTAFRHRRFWCNVIVMGTDGKALTQYPHSGEADVVWRQIGAPKSLVLDYKTLAGDVADSSSNLQLRDLAVLSSGELLITECATAIIQPLVTHTPEVCLYEAAELKRAEAEMFARVAASNAPDAPRVAGESQCNFCRAKTKCTNYSAFAGAMIHVGGAEPIVKELIFQTAMESWTPSQRAIAASLLLPARKVLDEIKDFLEVGLAADASFIPGWTLSKGRETEKITDPQACFDRFAALGGKLEGFMACVSVGKTKLKEAIHAVTGDKGRALDARLSKLTEGISETTTAAGSLVKSKESK